MSYRRRKSPEASIASLSRSTLCIGIIPSWIVPPLSIALLTLPASGLTRAPTQKALSIYPNDLPTLAKRCQMVSHATIATAEVLARDHSGRASGLLHVLHYSPDLVARHKNWERAATAVREERRYSLLLRYPGRRFACPGLLSFAPVGLAVRLATLASGRTIELSLSRFRVNVQLPTAFQTRDFCGVTLAEGRVFELITQFHFQFAIGNPFVRKPTLAVAVFNFRRERRHPLPQCLGEPAEEMDLRHRLIVHCVVNLAGPPTLQRGDEDGHQVIAVDHVDQAFAFARDLRFVPQI